MLYIYQSCDLERWSTKERIGRLQIIMKDEPSSHYFRTRSDFLFPSFIQITFAANKTLVFCQFMLECYPQICLFYAQAAQVTRGSLSCRKMERQAEVTQATLVKCGANLDLTT